MPPKPAAFAVDGRAYTMYASGHVALGSARADQKTIKLKVSERAGEAREQAVPFVRTDDNIADFFTKHLRVDRRPSSSHGV